MPTVDYLPIATGAGANVDTQGNFAGGGYQTVGFQSGIAQSAQLNKCWRQSSMIAAAIANFISTQLSISVLDDGNLANLITNFTNALIQATKPTTVQRTGTGAGSYNNSTTSFVDVDHTSLDITFTIPVGWKLIILATAVGSVVANNTAYFSLFDGAQPLVQTQVPSISASVGNTNPFALNWVVNGDGASHTISLQFKSLTGGLNASVLNSGSTIPVITGLLTPSL
jgi:hypothetical protein